MYCWISGQVIKMEMWDATNVSYIIAHETIESITDPLFPSTDAGVGQQVAWAGPDDPDIGYPAEICQYCEFNSNGTDLAIGTFSDGLQVPYYIDRITKKCVAPGSGEPDMNPSKNVTYTNHGGPIITNPVIWLIFWGSGWNSLSTERTSIINSIQNKLLNTDKTWWDPARSEYGNFAYPVWGGSVTYTGHDPINENAWFDGDVMVALEDAIIDGVAPNPIDNSRVVSDQLGSITVSNIIYVMLPDPSWTFDVNDPNAGAGAFHWSQGIYYADPPPPSPPPPPPNAPPPIPPSPPPPTVDASGNGFNTVDGLLGTAWTSTGSPYIAFDLGFILEVSNIKVDFLDGEKKMYFFDIDWSVDGVIWNAITPPSGTTTWRSSGSTASWESFSFPVVMTQWIRLRGHGNNAGSGSTSRNDTFAISEFQVWGPDVDMTIPPDTGGTGGVPSGTGEGAWVWSGTDWVWTTTVPGGTGGGGTGTGGGGTGSDGGSTGPNIPAAPPPIITVYKDFIDTYNLAVETGDFCAAGNVAAEIPLAKIYESPVTNMLVYFKLARAGGDVQRVGEAAVSDNSALIGMAPRKVTVTLKRVGTCDGVVYCRIRDNKNNIKQELGTIPAGSITLNDTTCDFENDEAQYIMKKGDVIWIEYDDPSANDGATYILYKAGDKDNFDAINSMFVKYTSTTIPDPLSDLAATIYV